MSASATLTDSQPTTPYARELVGRLLVTWQHPTTRAYHPVGVLERVDDGYEFAYLRRASHVDGFSPFLGFSDQNRRYTSPTLFPLFSERVMSPSRPDRSEWLEALGLGVGAHPMEILARSGGRRIGDTIELLPEPSVSPDGVTSCVFLAHGVRYVDGAEDRVDRLAPGERLTLIGDPDNPVNSRAVLVTAADHQRLGWAPDPLLDYIHTVRDCGEVTIAVVRANGPDVGPHLRLLVRMNGHVPPGYAPFIGPGWETAA